MSEPTDKMLHDWVRRTLDAHRPDYDPAGWEMLRQTRRRRRYRPGMLLGLLVLLVGGLLLGVEWYVGPDRTARVTPTHRPPKNAVPSLRKPTDLPEVSTQNARVASRPEKPEKPFLLAKPEPAIQGLPFPIPFGQLKRIANRPLLPAANLPGKPSVVPIPIAPVAEVLIQQQLLSGSFGSDSTSYRVLTRNIPNWPNAVVVCDFTTSMTPYSTQLYAWLNKNAHNPAIKGTVLFTDCDSLGRETRAGGPAGKMVVTSERTPARALPAFLEAARNTANNFGEAENDIEALLFAQKHFPDAARLILIADIDNPVKDLALLHQITKPVHVILCGRDWDSTQAFHPDYHAIASQTKGSLHTLEDDVDPARLQPNTWLRVGNRYYRYHRSKERFVLTRFRHRPRRLAGFLWW